MKNTWVDLLSDLDPLVCSHARLVVLTEKMDDAEICRSFTASWNQPVMSIKYIGG